MAVDLDDLFCYHTPKVVIVRDRWLGILRYTFLVATFAYIIFNIIRDQLYLQKEPIVGGTVKFTLEYPDAKDERPSYCNTSGYRCTFIPTELIAPANYTMNSMFLTTRYSIHDSSQTSQSCSVDFPETPECRLQFSDALPAKIGVVANIEKFYITIEHAILNNQNLQVQHNNEMKGALPVARSQKTAAGKTYSLVFLPPGSTAAEIKSEEPDSYNVTVRNSDKKGDRISVAQLLSAAGINSLDDIAPGSTQPYREFGIKMIIYIKYSNKVSDFEKLKYQYDISLMSGVQGKNSEILYRQSASPQYFNRAGISVHFVQTGTWGYFDFMALLRNLVASLALLSVGTLVVEILMIYVLPMHKFYSKAKFQLTDDFSDIRDRLESQKNTPMKTAPTERIISDDPSIVNVESGTSN